MEVYCPTYYNPIANLRNSSSFDSPVSLSPDHLDTSKDFSSSCVQTIKEEMDRSPLSNGIGMESPWGSYPTIPTGHAMGGFRHCQDYPLQRPLPAAAYSGTLQLHVDPSQQQSNIFIQVGHPCYPPRGPPTPPEPIRTESNAPVSQQTSTSTYVNHPAGAFQHVEWPVPGAQCIVPGPHSEFNVHAIPGATLPQTQPAAGSTKVCAHCGTTETPLWRRTSEGRFICNACGIYWKTNSCPRPVPRANSKRPRTTKTRDACCANCGTTVTSLWRRDQEGQTVCNACGLYYKLHKESRPIKLKKDHIKTRKRRCRGEELDRNTALHNCHIPSNYSSLQSIATSQGSFVMMSSTPTRDQHSPTSDNSVAMVTPQSRPSMQQTPYTEV